MHGGWRQTTPARIFVGRVAEMEAMTAALDAARAGDPQVVTIQGDAGIGKSSLVFEFLRRQPGVPVVIASGEMAEKVLSYGVIQQLAAGAAAVLGDTPAGLELLARAPRPDADPLAVGVEVRALIAALPPATRPRFRRPRAAPREPPRPLPRGSPAPGPEAAVVVVEDLQWADLPSARALLFACRRLVTDQVLVLLTCRLGKSSSSARGGCVLSAVTAGYRRSRSADWTPMSSVCCAGSLAGTTCPSGRSPGWPNTRAATRCWCARCWPN